MPVEQSCCNDAVLSPCADAALRVQVLIFSFPDPVVGGWKAPAWQAAGPLLEPREGRALPRVFIWGSTVQPPNVRLPCGTPLFSLRDPLPGLQPSFSGSIGADLRATLRIRTSRSPRVPNTARTRALTVRTGTRAYTLGLGFRMVRPTSRIQIPGPKASRLKQSSTPRP